MAACPACGTANPTAARFCMACAAPLATAAGTGAPVAREERKVITVLFADLAGFTARAEALDPEDVRAFLVPYYDVLSSEVTRYGGHVDRFLGDGIMALFGAPTAHEDDPERAVRAALRIMERVPALGLDLHVRIGINTGPVLFAPGWGGDRDDAVTGDAVNTAARLQTLAPVDGSVVGVATWRATAHIFAYEALEPALVKGKAERLAAWRALGTIAHPAGELHPEATPFVGRDLELSLLVGLFDRSRTTPSAELVTIVADPGIGKSRLVRELARHIEALPDLVTWRVGRCLPYGDGIGLWALGEIVKTHAGILDTDDQATLAAKLEAVLGEPDQPMRAWMKDRLGPLVGLETLTEPPQQEEAFTAWRRFIESTARTGPTVIVIEDLHWADDVLVAFLGHVVDRASGLPMLVVTTARPELEERHPTWLGRTRRSTVLSLTALPGRHMATLVESTLQGASPELVATVVERAGGSPLYAEQLAAMFRDRLVPIAGGVLEVDTIPPTIAALLAARIDALPSELKAVLLDASVIGKTFWSGAVAALGGREREQIAPLLAELARRELIRPAHPSSMAGEAEFNFVHALVRDVAYGELPRAARMARHRAIAVWITERAGAVLGEDAEIIVAHLEQALELATALGSTGDVPALQASFVDALLAAAASAMRTEVPRAVGLLRRAIGLLGPAEARRPAVLARLGAGLVSLDEPAGAAAVLEEARTLYLARGCETEAALLAIPLYRAYLPLGETVRADRIFGEAETALRTRGGPPLAVYLASAAQAAWTQSRSDAAMRLAEEAISLATDLGLAPPYRALNARGCVRLDRLDRSGGEADLREAIALSSAAGDVWATLVELDNLGGNLGDYSIPDALVVTDEEAEFARTHGMPTTQAELNRLALLALLGRWDEALAGAIRVEHASVERGDAFAHLFARSVRVTIEFERGDAGGDPSSLADEARTFRRPYSLAALHPIAARMAIAQGGRQLAEALLEELAEAFEPDEMPAPFDAVLAAAEAGRPDLARRLCREATALGRNTRLPDAIAAWAADDPTGARDLFMIGVAAVRTIGNVYHEAYALAGLGGCHLALGETEEGVTRIRESRAIWATLGATRRIAEIDTLLATTDQVTAPKMRAGGF